MMQRRYRFLVPGLAALAVVVALLAVAACGGEDATQAPLPSTATSTPQAEAAEPTVEPSPTAAPTATPEPTATAMPPEPTTTPVPEATQEPAATATPEPAATATPEPTATLEPTATPVPLPPCEGNRGGALGDCAPEFAGTQEWINTEPLTMERLRGKVVLIDFWTYSCINCIRTLPFMREWHDRYADEGLVIVGVHTPEFEFEKLYDNVVQATKDEMVAWPVVQDNEFTVWRSYSNRYWPAKYLVDQHGVIRYRHFGEGKYAETEEWIRQLLEEVGAETQAFTQPLPSDQKRDTASVQGQTPELFAGWNFTVSQRRGGIGQGETYMEAARTSIESEEHEAVVADFQVPSSVTTDAIYFQGAWAIGPESARHAQPDPEYKDFVLLVYSARSVNTVLTSDSGEPYKVVVTVNNEYLTEENKGDDIVIGEGGESYLMVTEPKAYKIIEHPEWQKHQILQMYSDSEDFGLFSFTFGSYEDGF